MAAAPLSGVPAALALAAERAGLAAPEQPVDELVGVLARGLDDALMVDAVVGVVGDLRAAALEGIDRLLGVAGEDGGVRLTLGDQQRDLDGEVLGVVLRENGEDGVRVVAAPEDLLERQAAPAVVGAELVEALLLDLRVERERFVGEGGLRGDVAG